MKGFPFALIISLFASYVFADSIPEVTVTGNKTAGSYAEDYNWSYYQANKYYAEQARRQNAARAAAHSQARQEAEARKKYEKCKAVATVNHRFCMDTLHKNNRKAVEFCNNFSLGLSVTTINPLVSGMVDANVGVCRSTRAARYLEFQSGCDLDLSLDNLACTDHL
ncbi:hypothetical protein [uncultured Gilvimarinus sp.]|uniref:hypothetical protein n=1 Tax=uncultured Gilvimarinus sp. TaxID=1689143 RepID=UPI0030DACC66